MKASWIQQITFAGFTVAIAALGYQPAMQAVPTSQLASQPTAKLERRVSESVSAAASTPTLLAQSASASFVGSAGHDTAGGARIVEEGGQRYLEFDAAFRSDSGPDLFVLLHRESVPQSYNEAAYVNLGRLQEIAGTQRYLIPANVNIQDFQSAVIWCQAFDVTFGYATL